MGGSCGLVSVILVLVLTVPGTQAQCTDQELNTLIQCFAPYNQKFRKIFETGNSCDRALISEDLCNDFADIVVCANQRNVSRRTCRPHAVGQLDQRLEHRCKVTDFKEVCRNAPAMDIGDLVKTTKSKPEGDLVQTTKSKPEGSFVAGHNAGNKASGAGISLGLLGVVLIVTLVAHMQRSLQ